jgi:hypothetical protein
MACSTCTSTCSNCTPPTPASTYCETCVDIVSSECVYYKGAYSNCLGLVKNFRLDDFIERTMSILCSLQGGGNTSDQRVTDAPVTRSASTNTWTTNYVFPTTSNNFNESFSITYNMASVDVEKLSSFTISANSSEPVSLCSDTDLDYYYVGIGHVHDGNSSNIGSEISTANIAGTNARINRQKVEGTIIITDNGTGTSGYITNLLLKCQDNSTSATSTIAVVPFNLTGSEFKQLYIQGITPVLSAGSTIWMEISNEVETENVDGIDIHIHNGNLTVIEIPSQS